MAAIWGAAIGAGAGLIGDVLQQGGQEATNQASIAIANANNATAMQLAQNQMTYRVADLKRAGLNPMLAAGGPGMSLPNLQQPTLGNPSQSFGNLGSQVTGALQLSTQQAQIEQLKASAAQANAQAANTQANTELVVPAQVEKIKSETGLNDVQATQVSKNVQLLNYGLTSGISQQLMQENVAQQAIKTHLLQADQQEREDTLLTLIKARNDTNFAVSIGAKNIASASDTEFGRIMSYFQIGKPAISGAADVMRAGAALIP